jgi:hypothetical protein
MLCTGISLLTEYYILKYPYWLNIMYWKILTDLCSRHQLNTSAGGNLALQAALVLCNPDVWNTLAASAATAEQAAGQFLHFISSTSMPSLQLLHFCPSFLPSIHPSFLTSDLPSFPSFLHVLPSFLPS